VCGRFARYSAGPELAALFGVEVPANLPARYNVAPSQEAVIVRVGEGGGRELAMAVWGFELLRPDGSAGLLINARCETAASKPAFRDSFRRRRCLVPANGFFEWAAGPPKVPHYLQRAAGGCLALAGLWEPARRPDAGALPRFTILTRDADAATRPIHDRMPVILPPEAFEPWLAGTEAAAVALLHTPWEVGLVASPVGRRVNDPENDDPGCIAAADQRRGDVTPRLPGI
jgi:putative SOS response-associated peptidase YedK